MLFSHLLCPVALCCKLTGWTGTWNRKTVSHYLCSSSPHQPRCRCCLWFCQPLQGRHGARWKQRKYRFTNFCDENGFHCQNFWPVQKRAIYHGCLNPKILEVVAQQDVHIDALHKMIIKNLRCGTWFATRRLFKPTKSFSEGITEAWTRTLWSVGRKMGELQIKPFIAKIKIILYLV